MAPNFDEIGQKHENLTDFAILKLPEQTEKKYFLTKFRYWYQKLRNTEIPFKTVNMDAKSQ